MLNSSRISDRYPRPIRKLDAHLKSLRKPHHRPGLLDGFLASTGLDLNTLL